MDKEINEHSDHKNINFNHIITETNSMSRCVGNEIIVKHNEFLFAFVRDRQIELLNGLSGQKMVV